MRSCFSCRLHGIPFLVSFLAPAVLILVGNSVAFVVVFYSLLTSGRKITSSRKITGFQRARQGAAILVLFGLTWLFGVLAIKDAKIVFQYLFCVFNSLQGLLVFVFYCVLSSRIRKKLKSFREKKGVNGSGKRNTVNLNMEVKNMKTKECKSKKTGQIANIESAFTANTLSKTPKEVFCFPNCLFQPAPTMQLRENVTSE